MGRGGKSGKGIEGRRGEESREGEKEGHDMHGIKYADMWGRHLIPTMHFHIQIPFKRNTHLHVHNHFAVLPVTSLEINAAILYLDTISKEQTIGRT